MTALPAFSTSCRPEGKAPDIVRIVEGVKGPRVHLRSELTIRFDYGRIVHRAVGA